MSAISRTDALARLRQLEADALAALHALPTVVTTRQVGERQARLTEVRRATYALDFMTLGTLAGTLHRLTGESVTVREDRPGLMDEADTEAQS